MGRRVHGGRARHQLVRRARPGPALCAHGDSMCGALSRRSPWLEKTHPDPQGEQLRKVAFVLKAFAAKAQTYGEGCRCGVFWDCALLPSIAPAPLGALSLSLQAAACAQISRCRRGAAMAWTTERASRWHASRQPSRGSMRGTATRRRMCCSSRPRCRLAPPTRTCSLMRAVAGTVPTGARCPSRLLFAEVTESWLLSPWQVLC
jgi:hypothetical protein